MSENSSSKFAHPDWAACNRTELYQWAREAGYPALPSMSKKELIALVEDKADWPSTPHAFDGLRIALMKYILSYWSVLKGSIQCPAKSGDPMACFNCLDQQIISCVNTNAAHEKEIRLHVIQPSPRKKQVEQLESKVMDIPIPSIPETMEELMGTPDYKIRAYANRLEMLKNEEMRAVLRAASATTEGKRRLCAAILLCRKVWMRCNGEGYNILVLKKDALDILNGKRQLNEVAEVDMPPVGAGGDGGVVQAPPPPSPVSVRPPPTPVYEVPPSPPSPHPVAQSQQVLPPPPPPPRESVRPPPTPVYDDSPVTAKSSPTEPPDWAKVLSQQLTDLNHRLDSLEDAVSVHGTAATVNKGFEEFVASRLDDIFVATILKNTELQALFSGGTPKDVVAEKLRKFASILERNVVPEDKVHSIYKPTTLGKAQDPSAEGGAGRKSKKK